MTPRASDLVHLKWLKKMGITTFADLRILDLGCGSGFICETAAQAKARKVIGVDILQAEFAKQQNWTFLALNLDEKNWQDSLKDSGPFDLILAFDILEHLSSPYDFLKSCRSLASSSGKLVLTTPNLNSWERHYRPETWTGVQDEQHKYLFSKYSLNFLLQKTGWQNIEIKAPMLSLEALGSLSPQIGGQLLALSSLNARRV